MYIFFVFFCIFLFLFLFIFLFFFVFFDFFDLGSGVFSYRAEGWVGRCVM